MGTFFFFGRYSPQSLKSVSAARTRKAEHVISRYRGKIRAMYALMGKDDLLLVVDLPGMEEALKVSVGLTKLTGITFNTVPAISVNEFDKIIQEL